MQVLNRRSYLDHKLSRISGIQSGIIFNFRIFNKGIDDMGGLNIVTGGMPEYTKLLISPDHDMSYHISGYGNFLRKLISDLWVKVLNATPELQHIFYMSLESDIVPELNS